MLSAFFGEGFRRRFSRRFPRADAFRCRRGRTGRGAGLGQTIGAAAPVGDFGFVNLVALVVGGVQARSGADRTIDVDQAAADAANQVMVVVADAILEASRQPGGLNTADETS